ncbi:MAG: protein translocase subunit SecF [Candidatus Pacearchaeota archaeon]|jgi:preprotein translocase subunit SecF
MENKKNWHDKNYKLLLLIPAAILIISLFYLFNFYSQNNSFFYKDITLTGGTTVTIYDSIDTSKLETDLSSQLEDLSTRTIYDFVTKEQEAVIIETRSDSETSKTILEDYLNYELTTENSSFEFTGSSLSESFFKQLMIAILVAFAFMAIVVFVIFRNFVPSTAVIISAFADIVMTLTLVDLFGIKMSSAGIVAFLMLVGYSVDTDILLTTRILKRQNYTLNKRIFGAFKTGMTMTLTSLFAVLFALFIVKSFSLVLTQIFTILVIGLSFDILNTWITNVSILKWHVEKKE